MIDTYQEEVISTRVLTVEGKSSNTNPNSLNSEYNDDNDNNTASDGTLIKVGGSMVPTVNGVWSVPIEYEDGGTSYEQNENTSSSTVICTALYNMGELDQEVYNWDSIYGKYVASAEAFSGYYVWARHIANAMYDRGIVYQMAKPLATAWANQMAHNLTDGKVGKSTMLGKTLKSVGEPVCHAIGSVMKLFNIKQSQLG